MYVICEEAVSVRALLCIFAAIHKLCVRALLCIFAAIHKLCNAEREGAPAKRYHTGFSYHAVRSNLAIQVRHIAVHD